MGNGDLIMVLVKAIFYLLKGDYRVLGLGLGLRKDLGPKTT